MGDIVPGNLEVIQPVSRFRSKRLLRRTAWTVVVFSIVAAGVCYLSYQRDRTRLRTVAWEVTAGAASPSEQVLGLLHWVYRIQGTRQNRSYFVFRRLQATPLQVLKAGGDCADKSRLLCALLREVGVPATVAMCFDAQTGKPTHTIVEAEPVAGTYMVVDPAYDLYFPKPDSPGYYDLLDLRRSPNMVSARVAELCAQSPLAREADVFYMRPSTTYERAATINWNKNAALGFVHRRLKAWYGDDVYRLRRPILLQEPKLFVTAIFLLPGAIALLALGGAAMMHGPLRWRNRPLRLGH